MNTQDSNPEDGNSNQHLNGTSSSQQSDTPSRGKIAWVGYRTNVLWKRLIALVYICYLVIIVPVALILAASGVWSSSFAFYMILLFWLPYLFSSNVFGIRTSMFGAEKTSRFSVAIANLVIIVCLFVLLAISGGSSNPPSDSDKTVSSQSAQQTAAATAQQLAREEAERKAREDAETQRQAAAKLKKELAEKKKAAELLQAKKDAKPRAQKITEAKARFRKIYKAYKSNEVAAEDKYEGNVYAIYGEINNITEDSLLTLFSSDIQVVLEIHVGNTLCFVHCFFDKTERDSIKRLSSGQKILVRGTCSNWGNWEDCEIQ